MFLLVFSHVSPLFVIAGVGATFVSDCGATSVPDRGATFVSDCGATFVSDCGITSVTGDNATFVTGDNATSVPDCGATSVPGCGATSFMGLLPKPKIPPTFLLLCLFRVFFNFDFKDNVIKYTRIILFIYYNMKKSPKFKESIATYYIIAH